MKKFIVLVLAFCILNISYMNKSEAVVGLLLNSKTTRVAGGIVSVASIGTAASAGAFHAIYGYTYGAMVFATLGFVGAYVGVILLEDNSGNLNFVPMSSHNAEKLQVSQKELDIYNSEVEELNNIKEVIEAQVSNNVTELEVTELWKDYRVNLSPETMQVASKIVLEVFNNKFMMIK